MYAYIYETSVNYVYSRKQFYSF